MTGGQRYPKQVFWSDEDEGFIALAPDLPGCSAFGTSEVEALSELDLAIDAWVDATRSAGNPVPAPSTPALRTSFSGKLLLRMPRSLHQNLAEAARHEDVSLNQFIVSTLSRYFGRLEGTQVNYAIVQQISAESVVNRSVMLVGTIGTAASVTSGVSITRWPYELNSRLQRYNAMITNGAKKLASVVS